MTQATDIPEWTLGWRLQRSLAHAGVSMDEMAAELGISRRMVSRWINEHAVPRMAYLKVWALRTDVPLEWLVSGGLRRGPFCARPGVWWLLRAWRWLCRDLTGPLPDDEDYETGLELIA